MKIGVLGYGSIGKRHVKNLEAMGHRCYVYDPANHLTTSRKHVMEEAEAIVIASPTKEHITDIFTASVAGKPIFVEKPIVSSLSDMATLAQVAQERIFVGYNLRFLPVVSRMKNVLMQEKVYPIWARFTCSQFNENDVYRRDGIILNWSHEIDLALHLLGLAKVMSSWTKVTDTLGLKQDVLTHITLQHDSGCISHIHLDYLVQPQVRGFAIIGADDQSTCDLVRGTLLRERTGQNTTMLMDDGEFDSCYLREMEAFIDFCNGEGNHGCSAAEAVDVMNICLEVRRQAGLEV